MEDIIDIIVTETTNTIEITSQSTDEVIDVNIIDNRDDITLNVTPTLVEININSLTSNFGVNWGDITGTLSNQTDLNTALGLKADLVGGKVPSSQLPSYVDDVVEVATYSALPATGETGKIYVVLDTNLIYRWSGSAYIEIKDSSAVWGAITGTLSNQTDLQNALNGKMPTITFNSPLFIGSGGDVTIPLATTTANGYLSSTDWNTFNNKANDSLVVHLAGAETITGLKTFSGGLIANVTSGGNQGFASTNTSTSATSVFVQNNSTGIGILANNASTGDAILIGNDTSGRGIYITNATISGSGKGISIDNYNSGIGIEVGSDSSEDAIKVLHLAGRGLNIQSSGGGYGLIINNTTASTSTPFTIQKQGVTKVSFTDAGAATFTSSVTASSYIVPGGTSSQFLKANGTLDSNTYLTTSSASSTYLPLTGGTLTGNLSGTSATFTGQTKIESDGSTPQFFIKETDVTGQGSTAYFQLSNNTIYIGNGNASYGTLSDKLTIASTGAATFSSSVTATQVSIGTTSPATFLHVNGATAALPATSGTSQSAGNRIRLSTAAGTGILDIGCAGGTGMWLQSTDLTDLSLKYPILLNPNGGNVGIGTTNPLAKLTVSNAQSEGFEFAPAISSNVNRILSYNRGTSVYNGFVLDGETLYFKTYDAERMRITSSGNVGIGNTNPFGGASSVNGLHITSLSVNSAFFRINNASYTGFDVIQGTDGTGYLTLRDNAAMQFHTNNTERMRITSAGNVGIGTTSPSNRLSVFESTGTTTSTMDFSTTGNAIKGHVGMFANNFYITSNWFYNGTQNADNTGYALNAISFDNSGFMNFQTAAAGATSPTERMRITSGGNVLIGTTSDIAGAVSMRTNISASNFTLGLITDSGASQQPLRFVNGSTAVGSVTTSTSTTSYNVVSDYRLKEDLKPINGLEIVNRIKVYDYKWKVSDSRMDGVMAHELQEVLPYAVTGVKDGEQMQSVDYSKIVPVMVQAIKDLKAELDTLKNK